MTSPESSSLEVIIQAGAVGIAVLLILYSAWKDKIYNRTLSNHLKHFTDALDRNSQVIEQNGQAYGKVIQCNEQILRIMERVERVLDNK